MFVDLFWYQQSKPFCLYCVRLYASHFFLFLSLTLTQCLALFRLRIDYISYACVSSQHSFSLYEIIQHSIWSDSVPSSVSEGMKKLVRIFFAMSAQIFESKSIRTRHIHDAIVIECSIFLANLLLMQMICGSVKGTFNN